MNINDVKWGQILYHEEVKRYGKMVGLIEVNGVICVIVQIAYETAELQWFADKLRPLTHKEMGIDVASRTVNEMGLPPELTDREI